MCEARTTLAYNFLRGNPLNTLPPSKPKAGDACGGSPGDAPSQAGCSVSAEVLGKEGSWTRRWLPVGSYHGSRLIPPTSLAPGAWQKRSPPHYSFCYLLIDSSCQRLFALGRPSGRRGRGGLGRTGTLLHRRWTVFLSSLPKGKEKASGGYSQGGSNSLFFHPAGEHILPSALCSPGQQGYVLPSPATTAHSTHTLGEFKGPHIPFGAVMKLVAHCRLL